MLTWINTNAYTAGLFIKLNTNGNILNASISTEQNYYSFPIEILPNNNGSIFVSTNIISNSGSNYAFLIGKIPSLHLLQVSTLQSVGINFILAPNPCTDIFFVINDTEEPVIVQVYETNGKLVLTQNINGNFTGVNVSALQKGLYLVKINNTVHKLLIN